ncbi:hypothetical protein [Jidongwangia harbinensis]|uniref:hypothetical protein n=1 Tax=Jidongwangia harbinensis TaxID=2878561 RepID=UPI001CDA2B14|nr:hypothetical protein [Jidongwangia harbinensis]MCA2212375.1 hypothetical protein [Jidongwangia harbinensis]
MRSALRVLTGLSIAGLLILLTGLTWANDREPVPGRDGTDIVRVGVVDGQPLSGYLHHSRIELDGLLRASGVSTGVPTWALVSLAGYLPPDRLPAVLGGAAVAEVYARAPLPGAATGVVRIPVYRWPDDVTAGMLAAAARRDQEQADYRRLGDRVSDDNRNVLRLRAAYRTAAEVAAAEAHAYRGPCACVFAAVVHADPGALREIAGRTEVRVVDPAPEVRRVDRVEFRPPLPEEQVAAPHGTRSASAPAPSGTSTVAPVRPVPLPSASGVAVTSDSSGDSASEPGPVATASEDPTAVPSAPAASSPRPDLLSAPQGASRGASGR